MSGSPHEHGKRMKWEQHYKLGKLSVKAHIAYVDGDYVKAGELNEERYLLICEILGKEAHQSSAKS